MLNCSMFIVLRMMLLLCLGKNIWVVFFLVSFCRFWCNCLDFSGFFRCMWWNSFGVKCGMLVKLKFLFLLKVLLIWMVLWLCRLMMLLV